MNLKSFRAFVAMKELNQSAIVKSVSLGEAVQAFLRHGDVKTAVDTSRARLVSCVSVGFGTYRESDCPNKSGGHADFQSPSISGIEKGSVLCLEGQLEGNDDQN